MLNRLKITLILLLGFVPLSLAAVPAPVFAGTTQQQIQSGIDTASGKSAPADPGGTLSGIIRRILNILSAFAGVAAIIMIIVAGFRMVASAGSEESVKKAKNSLVYAVVGIVIVALAQIIVHFVIHNVA